MLSKKLLVPALVIAVGGSALLATSTLVHAQSGASPFGGLAQAIASKFNLNQSDVQTFMSTYMQQNMQNRQKSHFDQLVTQGKITSAQEAAILAELATLKSQNTPGSMKSMTPEQRKQAFQTQKDTMTAWAKSQGIDPQYVMPFGGMGRGRNWHKPLTSPTPTP